MGLFKLKVKLKVPKLEVSITKNPSSVESLGLPIAREQKPEVH